MAVIVLSCLVLIGWLLDLATVKAAFPAMVAMNPGGTALAFLFGGVSLWLLQTPRTSPQHRIGRALAVGVTLWAIVRLAGYQQRVAGLGERFLRRFDAAISRIQAAPDRWAVVQDDRVVTRILVLGFRSTASHPFPSRVNLALAINVWEDAARLDPLSRVAASRLGVLPR